MENFTKTAQNIITLIDIYGYISAFYELIIKHNWGIGTLLTLVSLLLSIIIYVMKHADYIKARYKEKINENKKSENSISPGFIKLAVAYVSGWLTIVLFGGLINSTSIQLSLLIVLLTLPAIYSIITWLFCHITEENFSKYGRITFIISLVLSIMFSIFCIPDIFLMILGFLIHVPALIFASDIIPDK